MFRGHGERRHYRALHKRMAAKNLQRVWRTAPLPRTSQAHDGAELDARLKSVDMPRVFHLIESINLALPSSDWGGLRVRKTF